MPNHKELVGVITDKKIERVRRKNSKHFGNTYWRLRVNIEDEPEIKEIVVFKEWLEQESIWPEIEQWDIKKHSNKRYLFKVQRKPGAGQFFRLIGWEEIRNYSTKQVLNHHGSN
jgi:hypothetical protein